METVIKFNNKMAKNMYKMDENRREDLKWKKLEVKTKKRLFKR